MERQTVKQSPLETVLNALEANQWNKEANDAKNLLEAAPDLLEACKFADEAIKNMTAGQSKKIHDKLQKAIAKAEGKREVWAKN